MMKNNLDTYCMNRFPQISITGERCALNCKHCNRHYLRGMTSATSPERLIEICKEFDKKGVNGILLSGGCNRNGEIQFNGFFKAIEKIKKKTNLIINAHTGLINKENAINLGKAGVDVVSVDIVGSDETIKEVYGINKTTLDFEKTLEALSNSKISSIVPHICIGLHFGELRGELNALKMIKKNLPNLSKIVLIVLIPTKGTEMEKINFVPLSDIEKVIIEAKKLFSIPILLGCMRPRTREIEKVVVKAGIDGIANPSKNILKWAEQNGFEIKNKEACCAVSL